MLPRPAASLDNTSAYMLLAERWLPTNGSLRTLRLDELHIIGAAWIRSRLTAGGSRIRTVGPAESKTGTGLLTLDHEELVGRGFGPPNLAFATSKLPHAGVAVG